jgi:hypothetical protein
MGSRKQPNHGGSGKSHTRKSRPEPDPKSAVGYEPIKTVAELELYLSGDKICCLLCGEEFKSLGHHLARSHSTNSRAYKELFNIPVTRSLLGNDLKNRKREITKSIWQDSPKMEGVRKSLKANIKNLDGTKHKSKSSLSIEIAKNNGDRLKSFQLDHTAEKFRPVYLDSINKAIAQNITLYVAASGRTQEIYNFAKRHANDSEFIERLGMVKKGACRNTGEGLEVRECSECGSEFEARPARNQRTCSRECSDKAKLDRVPVVCVICNKTTMMTRNYAKRLTTCGSVECKKERGRINTTEVWKKRRSI